MEIGQKRISKGMWILLRIGLRALAVTGKHRDVVALHGRTGSEVVSLPQDHTAYLYSRIFGCKCYAFANSKMPCTDGLFGAEYLLEAHEMHSSSYSNVWLLCTS